MQYLLILIFDVFAFQACIERIFPQIRYADEILSIIIIICAYVTICLRPKRLQVLNKNEFKIIYYTMLLVVIGFISTFIYNKGIILNLGMIKDILALLKPIINFILFAIVFKNVDKNKILSKLSFRCKIYLNIIFFFCILNFIFDFGMSHGNRFGIRCFKFLYTHPTYLAFSVVIFMSIIIANDVQVRKIYLIEGFIILISTFRSKAFMFIIGYLIITIYNKYSKKIKIEHLISILILGVFITFGKINDYFIHGLNAARPALYIISTKIMLDYIPFGTGFCSFGSALSGEYYSSVYTKYNIDHVTGLTMNNYAYMADSFWPYVTGQFGIIGFIVYLLILINIYKCLQGRYFNSENKLKAINLLFFYLLFSSLAEAIFIDVTGQFVFILFAVFLGYGDIESEKYEKNILTLDI